MAEQLFTFSTLGSETVGAVIGEPPQPHAMVLLGAGDYLTTGDLANGESGDMGGQGEFTVELWLQVRGALPASTIDLVRGPPGGGGAVQWRLRLNPSGTLSAIMRTGAAGASTFTATSTVAVPLTTDITNWDYVVATVTGTFLRIYYNNVQIASTAVSGEMPFVDVGGEMLVGDSAIAGATELAIDELAVHRIGLAANRVEAHYVAARSRGYRSQLTGARAHAVLDSIRSTVPRRIDAGLRTIVPIYLQGQNPLDELRNCHAAEAVETMLFIARDGAIVFLDSDHRASSPYDAVQATFDDDGTDLPYQGLGTDYSDSFLANKWNATRPGNDATTQTVFDQASIDKYGEQPQSLSPPVTTDAQASSIASALLAKYKEPFSRISSITFSTGVPELTEAVFRRDLGDRIRVFRTPPGGGARSDQTLFIQKIETSGANNGTPWQVRWIVSPL